MWVSQDMKEDAQNWAQEYLKEASWKRQSCKKQFQFFDNDSNDLGKGSWKIFNSSQRKNEHTQNIPPKEQHPIFFSVK